MNAFSGPRSELRELAGEFADIDGVGIQANRSLARVTTYGIGGDAGCLLQPDHVVAFAQAVRRCRARGLPVRFLGGGSNLLVADAGFAGVVLRTRGLRALQCDREQPGLVHAGAGVGLARLVRWCAMRGLTGTEVLAGIPGTVGGAVAMNAGGRHGEIAPLLRTVITVTPDGSLRRRHPSELGFGYRTSRLRGEAVVRVVLALTRSSQEEAHGRMRTILREKALSQPLRARSAGCVFKNPATPRGPGPAGPRTRSAGWLIDRAGCKGERVGGVVVSHRHANFFVNEGAGSASDVLLLAARVRTRVFERFGITLEPELQLWSEQLRDRSILPAAG